VPRIGPGELLVRIEASGICGSDVMEWYRLHRAPLVLGHEIGGQVVETGEGVTAYRAGDRVTVAHHVPCNTCRACLSGHHTTCETLQTTNFDPGGFAEYVRVPAINVDRGVFRLPDEVSYEMATFVEPLACVIRGQRRTGVTAGQNILVVGSGISGLIHVALARATGAGHITATDVVPFRLEMAKTMGADTVFRAANLTPDKLREANSGLLADTVIVCTGALAAYKQALASVEPGGTVLVFAPTGPDEVLPLSINDFFWRKDTTITTTYAGAPADHVEALDLIRTGQLPLEQLITHRLPFAEIGRGFKLVAEAREGIKVIILPQR
jgi:L-iditol 2-dehydrogenase